MKYFIINQVASQKKKKDNAGKHLSPFITTWLQMKRDERLTVGLRWHCEIKTYFMANNTDKQMIYIMTCSEKKKICISQILYIKIGTKIQLEAKIDFSTTYINFKMKFLLINSI